MRVAKTMWRLIVYKTVCLVLVVLIAVMAASMLGETDPKKSLPPLTRSERLESLKMAFEKLSRCEKEDWGKEDWFRYRRIAEVLQEELEP